MTVFNELVKRFEGVNIYDYVKDILESPNVKMAIIERVQSRLYDKGEDNEGKQLRTDIAKQQGGGRVYSRFTAAKKQAEGKKFSNVTLKDSGEFYNSMRVDVFKKYAKIKADFLKSEGHIYENFESSYSGEKDFEYATLSLNDNGINALIHEIILPYVMIEIRNQLNIKKGFGGVDINAFLFS